MKPRITGNTTYDAYISEQWKTDMRELKRIIEMWDLDTVLDMCQDADDELQDECDETSDDQYNDPRTGQAEELNK